MSHTRIHVDIVNFGHVICLVVSPCADWLTSNLVVN